MSYISPYVLKQREVENKRAKAASKQLAVLRERANKMAPHSSSASLNKPTNEWNGLTLTNSVFDPTVKKVDIFRLTAGDKDKDKDAAANENGKPNRPAVVGANGTIVKSRNERRKLFAEAIADVLGDQKVANIFHKDSAGRISIPESVENLQATLESARRAQANALLRKQQQQQQLAQEESEQSVAHIESSSSSSSSRSTSPRGGRDDDGGLRSPAASSHSHSPRGDHRQFAGSNASTPVHARNGRSKTRGSWAVRSPRSVADSPAPVPVPAAGREVSTSPMDLSLVGDMAGLEDGDHGEAFGLDADTYVPVPMYPYSRAGQGGADSAHMASLVQALNGLVSQMEQQQQHKQQQGLSLEAGELSVAPRRALQGAGAVLEDSFIFTGAGIGTQGQGQRQADRDRDRDDNPLFFDAGERTPAAKLQARQLLSDKVVAHLSREGPATAHKHWRGKGKGRGRGEAAMAATTADVVSDSVDGASASERESEPAPHSLGAVRDLILTKLQDVERCHAAAVDLLLHPPQDSASASEDGANTAEGGEMGQSSRTSSSNTARTSSRSSRGGGGVDRGARNNKNRSGSSYQTDAGRLETAVHMHPLAHHAPTAELQATRLPRARTVGVDFHCSHPHPHPHSHHHAHADTGSGSGGSAGRRQPNASDVITFTQSQSSASLRVGQGQGQGQSSPDAELRRHRQAEAVRSWAAGNRAAAAAAGMGEDGEGDEDEEVADYERKVAAHFTGALRAPCFSSTHETALRAAKVPTGTEVAASASASSSALPGDARGGGKGAGAGAGAAKEFGSHAQNAFAAHHLHADDPDSFRMQAMREQRRVSMGRLPRLSSPASVTQNCQEWKKQLRFARELRDMALKSRGISFHYYQDRATDMILDDLVAAVAQEVDAALDEEVARFVTKI